MPESSATKISQPQKSSLPGHGSSVDLVEFKASHAAILTMELVGQAGHLTADIRYEPGQFMISTHVHSGPSTVPRAMTQEEITALHKVLAGSAKQTVPGVDITALETFTHYLAEATTTTQPSNRFDQAVFGDIHKDHNGVLIGSMRVGIDVAGLVHDAHGSVTVATYVVMMKKPGPFRHLSAADKASLVRALEKAMAKTPPPNPLWRDVLQDLRK